MDLGNGTLISMNGNVLVLKAIISNKEQRLIMETATLVKTLLKDAQHALTFIDVMHVKQERC